MKTDEFTTRLNLIDKSALKIYLENLKTPCYEATLLQHVFPEMPVSNTPPLTLYQNHFLLFHLLYKLQDEYYQLDYYLYIHFMRTFLIKYPALGLCRHYQVLSGQFCAATCQEQFCEQHTCGFQLEELSDRYFYLDTGNYYKLDHKTARDFINGTWEFLNAYDDFEKSCTLLDVSPQANIKLIKKKFRSLAHQYHPDHGASNAEQFNKINNAYRLLLRLHSGFMQ